LEGCYSGQDSQALASKAVESKMDKTEEKTLMTKSDNFDKSFVEETTERLIEVQRRVCENLERKMASMQRETTSMQQKILDALLMVS
jgi:hypothetical protein